MRDGNLDNQGKKEYTTVQALEINREVRRVKMSGYKIVLKVEKEMM